MKKEKPKSLSKPSVKSKSLGRNQTSNFQLPTSNLWLFIAPILILTFIVFYPSIKNGLTNWDDPSLITDNPLIKELSFKSVKRIFSEVYFGNYQPLHIFSYAIEYHFFQLNPAGYHAVSLFMHLINVVLVFFLIQTLSNNNNLIAFITALMFAINPLRTESVCWAAERKDMLYSMFFFAALIFYIKGTRGKGNSVGNWQLAKSNYIGAFLFFVLSVFSKTMAVSLIPVLFLVDIYLGRNFTVKLFLEKIPFLILAIIMGLVSVKAGADEGSIDTSGTYTFVDRIFFACHNLIMYFVKSIIPFSQSAFYPYPDKPDGHIPMEYYGAGVIVLLVAVFTIMMFKRSKEIFFSISFFVATVFLVLMLIPIGPTVFSERYSYIPSVALFFLIAFYINQLILKKPDLKPVLIGAICMVALFFSYLTFQRSKVWKDSITLWIDVLNQYPGASHPLNNLGDAYFNNGDLNAAITNFTASINNAPEYASAYYNRGNAYGQTGKPNEALADLNLAIKYDPKRVEAYNKRGQAYGMLGNVSAAEKDFNKALQMKPEYAEVYFNLGITYLNANQKDKACDNLRKAVDMGFANAAKPLSDYCK